MTIFATETESSTIMRKKTNLFILFLATILTLSAQSESQAKLLSKAYKSHSTKMLCEFFDNWSEEVKSNEGEAQNPYVAEAHKVFAAFYQPLQTEESGERITMYDDKSYFIVQGSLWKISEAEVIPYKLGEIDSFMVASIIQEFPDDTVKQKEWMGYRNNYRPDYRGYAYPSFCKVATLTIDSAIEFRPPVHFEGKKVVYLTKGYEKLLNSFLGNKHVALGEENIMQPAYSKGNSRSKHRFFNNAALIFYGHWGGYWQYETYPKANQIILNPEMNRAVVLFRFVYEGGEAVLEKQNGEWKVVDFRFTWIE